jgi:hypothetical protein
MSRLMFGSYGVLPEWLVDLPMDRGVLELAVVCLAACAGLALAWAHEADFFAMFFAVAAAISGVEAIRRSCYP